MGIFTKKKLNHPSILELLDQLDDSMRSPFKEIVREYASRSRSTEGDKTTLLLSYGVVKLLKQTGETSVSFSEDDMKKYVEKDGRNVVLSKRGGNITISLEHDEDEDEDRTECDSCGKSHN